MISNKPEKHTQTVITLSSHFIKVICLQQLNCMYVVDLANCDTLFMQNRSINLYLICACLRLLSALVPNIKPTQTRQDPLLLAKH